MSRLRFLAVLVCAAVSLSATPLFVSGDLLWAAQDGRIYDISKTRTSPLNFATGHAPIANVGGTVLGQMAFSLDAKTAYVTVFGSNKVVTLTDSGQVSNHVTGIANPTGIIRTSTGKMLVASYTDGKIYDITSGSPVVYATGLVNPRNMVETAAGIYVADQGNSTVKLLIQGNMASVTPLAYGIDAVSIASFNNRLYVTSNSLTSVYDVTAGGNMTAKTPVAKNKYFTSLAVANGHLYAGTNSSTAAASGIWEIPKSGNSYTTANAETYNMAISGDSLLSVVPDAVIVTPPASVPEPGTVIAGFSLLTFGLMLRRRCQALAS
ncbi:MAG: hypothetical protein SGI92_26775 [Bryobacteraceae bacterium]|nr:hypothetical protein [Bryobacteraceae bacterium]